MKHYAPTLPPATITAREALQQYFDENGFDAKAYTEPTVEITAGPFIAFRIPNGPSRQKAIALHDLHHVVTGYGTDLVGEAEVGAWELRAGCNSLFLWYINTAAVLMGMALSPRRVLRAFRAARGCTSLYRAGAPADELYPLRVGELRARTGVPEGGVAVASERALHAKAPASRPARAGVTA